MDWIRQQIRTYANSTSQVAPSIKMKIPNYTFQNQKLLQAKNSTSAPILKFTAVIWKREINVLPRKPSKNACGKGTMNTLKRENRTKV